MRFYRITSPDDTGGVAYTKDRLSAEQVAGIIIGNGYRARIQCLSKMQVPLSEIHIVNEL